MHIPQIFKLILMSVMLCVETLRLDVEDYWDNICSCRGLLHTDVTSRALFYIGSGSEIFWNKCLLVIFSTNFLIRILDSTK